MQEKISCLFSIEDIEGTLLSVLSTEAIVVGDGKAKCSKLFIDETNATEIKSKSLWCSSERSSFVLAIERLS